VSAILLGALLGSAATAYLIGYRVVAPRESFWRTKFGMWVLIALGLTFVILPPQVSGLDSAADSIGSTAGGIGASLGGLLSMPGWFNKPVYLVVWVLTSLVALLVGMRIWKVRDPEWRPATVGATESAAVRAQGLLPLAGSLDEVFATLTAAPLTARDIEFLAPQLLFAGARFGAGLPEKRSDAFNVVARRVSPAIATRVTELLQQGAAEKAGS